jgi:hypothetical protein
MHFDAKINYPDLKQKQNAASVFPLKNSPSFFVANPLPFFINKTNHASLFLPELFIPVSFQDKRLCFRQFA